MLPVWSFILVLIAEFWSYGLKFIPLFYAFILKGYIIIDIIVLTIMETQIKKWYMVRHDLVAIEPPIQSVWMWDPLGTPHYSLIHR